MNDHPSLTNSIDKNYSHVQVIQCVEHSKQGGLVVQLACQVGELRVTGQADWRDLHALQAV